MKKCYKLYMLVNLEEFIDLMKSEVSGMVDSRFLEMSNIQYTLTSNPMRKYDLQRSYSPKTVEEIKNGSTFSNYIIKYVIEEVPNTVSNYPKYHLTFNRQIEKVKKINNMKEVVEFIEETHDKENSHFYFNEELDLYLIFNKSHDFYKTLTSTFITYQDNLYGWGCTNDDDKNKIISEEFDYKEVNYHPECYSSLYELKFNSSNNSSGMLQRNTGIWNETCAFISRIKDEKDREDAFKKFMIAADFIKYYTNYRINSYVTSLYNVLNLDKDTMTDFFLDFAEKFKKQKIANPLSKVMDTFLVNYDNRRKLIGPKDSLEGNDRIISDEDLLRIYDFLVKEKSYTINLTHLLNWNDKSLFDLSKIDKTKYIKFTSIADYNKLMGIQTDYRVQELCRQFTTLGAHADLVYPAIVLLITNLDEKELEANKDTLASTIFTKLNSNNYYSMSRELRCIIKRDQDANIKFICDEVVKLIEQTPSGQSRRAKIRIISNGCAKSSKKRNIFNLLHDSIIKLNSVTLNKILVDESI